MVQSLLNHIQGKNGSRWAKFIRDTGTENILVVAVDAAKFTHKAMFCNFYGDILVKPFHLGAVPLSHFNKMSKLFKQIVKYITHVRGSCKIVL